MYNIVFLEKYYHLWRLLTTAQLLDNILWTSEASVTRQDSEISLYPKWNCIVTDYSQTDDPIIVEFTTFPVDKCCYNDCMLRTVWSQFHYWAKLVGLKLLFCHWIESISY